MQLSSAQRSCVARGQASRRPRAVSVAAAKTRSKVGFRYDPANLRWVRDDRLADLSVDDSKTVIQPKTGAAYQAWPVVHTVLNDAGLKTVSCEEAAKLSKQGWTLIDVRLAGDFEKWHAEGAVNVPLYRYVEGQGPWDNLKRLAMFAFAMKATERNPDFISELNKTVKKNSKILVMCAIGGTLDTLVSYRREKKLYNDPERQFGRESRSLKAVYEMLESGWSVNNIRHVDGGFQQWRFQGLPTNDDEE
ncbi:hypothetical protein MNEG_3803 [Monoraphidium neglectum]|uniref:Rhodanese domain-containing protein n=1 Tax=Monoraphidium neglectum TaxID=145388 RepID=A0A0D2MN87_9CHLO|nr:hypothetical protein MNEG_3803 [Monoraphidium neglectum]KIZ04155.1 hypothetical protein MNEG_3803 [Monoraphidium neglectum]|eukprot:XP_013903174.1 hypothetical protein MNEG_3803 [Monoraphidium neglectum]